MGISTYVPRVLSYLKHFLLADFEQCHIIVTCSEVTRMQTHHFLALNLSQLSILDDGAILLLCLPQMHSSTLLPQLYAGWCTSSKISSQRRHLAKPQDQDVSQTHQLSWSHQEVGVIMHKLEIQRCSSYLPFVYGSETTLHWPRLQNLDLMACLIFLLGLLSMSRHTSTTYPSRSFWICSCSWIESRTWKTRTTTLVATITWWVITSGSRI